ncbi:deoxyribonuclease V [Chloroflexota bacterium]
MKVHKLHSWQVSPAEALDLQRWLAGRVSRIGEVSVPRFIAGVDMALEGDGMAIGSVVILSYPQLKLVEIEVVRGKLEFPYIPGLLSFRESPLILAACESLTIFPDLLLVDGQGVAHPRRFGLASHLGLLLDIPTIGCAKSLLYGHTQEPGFESGSHCEIVDNCEIIGVTLRTKLGVKPVYVSTGHKVDLMTVIPWVLKCCRGYRLPEPLRLAHLAAGGKLRLEKKTVAMR